jgi:hypothetical protein
MQPGQAEPGIAPYLPELGAAGNEIHPDSNRRLPLRLMEKGLLN